MTENKKKLIVVDEHTLACVTGYSEFATVLASSPLKGATSSCPLSSMDPIDYKRRNVRLATKEDFEEFRVLFSKEYEEYEYQKTDADRYNVFDTNGKLIAQDYKSGSGKWMHKWANNGVFEKGGWPGKASGQNQLTWKYEAVI